MLDTNASEKPLYCINYLFIIVIMTYVICPGVPCACPSLRSCSIYETCRRRCMHTMDRFGVGLPILLESGTDRRFEAANKVAKCHIDTGRMKRSNSTRQLEGSYRYLLKGVTSYLSRLVQNNQLPYSVLKRWVYSLRLDLKVRIPERNPKVEKMLNGFYSKFYDTERLRKLMIKVEEYITWPPTVNFKMALQKFEDEVDNFLSSRVFLHGIGGDGRQNAMFCVDPEWSVYPARDLYQIHKRVCEALLRVRGEHFIIVFFCTVLKEYMLLNHVESFVQKLRDRVERQPVRIEDPDDCIMTPLSEETADTPSALITGNESECGTGEDQVQFPFGIKVAGNNHSAFFPGIKLEPFNVLFSLANKGGWSSLDYAVSVDRERVQMARVIRPFLNSFGP